MVRMIPMRRSRIVARRSLAMTVLKSSSSAAATADSSFWLETRWLGAFKIGSLQEYDECRSAASEQLVIS
jgi:hypothetical protein